MQWKDDTTHPHYLKFPFFLVERGFCVLGGVERNARGLGRRNYLIEGVAPIELPGQRVNQFFVSTASWAFRRCAMIEPA
jgi:hypothetical protein